MDCTPGASLCPTKHPLKHCTHGWLNTTLHNYTTLKDAKNACTALGLASCFGVYDDKCNQGGGIYLCDAAVIKFAPNLESSNSSCVYEQPDLAPDPLRLTMCPAGMFSDPANKYLCQACPARTFKDANMATATACIRKSTVCTELGNRFFSRLDLFGAESAVADDPVCAPQDSCPPGAQVDESLHVEGEPSTCIRCPAGLFSDRASSLPCKAKTLQTCDPGRYWVQGESPFHNDNMCTSNTHHAHPHTMIIPSHYTLKRKPMHSTCTRTRTHIITYLHTRHAHAAHIHARTHDCLLTHHSHTRTPRC